ncbi:uncharacterized protein (DUF2147 family) [Bosea psychrotolerans]|uniref:Uncharacterized protein (DUF2147 family) n=2 Tax=Bosea psychrotolerans TaxID=1871628 RepID=A0A2S4MAG5_9HYPH|nr:uncharacterized protein (DUF2147 family) [Bosea psychrotolerans]
MGTMRRALSLALGTVATLLFAQIAMADSLTDIIGRWRDSDGESEIEIARCGPALCGTIVWLKQPRIDSANPDPANRGRPLLGLRVLSGFKPDPAAATFSGDGYNPEDGRSYKTTLELKSKTTLSIKGCVMGGLICDDDIWTRRP